jgi:hypothetical protein
MTILVTGVFAIPLLAVVAYLAVQLRDDAMRPERAPVKSTSLCVNNSIAESDKLEPTPEGPQPRSRATLDSVCSDGNSVFTQPKRTTSFVLRDLDYPDWYLYSTARFTSTSWVPDLSVWPFTDPDTIRYSIVPEDRRVPPPPTPDWLKEYNPALYQAITDVQRTLNQRILLLAGGAIVLIALVATSTWLALRRAFRPTAAAPAVPPTGMGSIVSRLNEVSSDLVLLARLDTSHRGTSHLGTESPDSFDLAVVAHQETAHRYPPDLAYVVDLGDDPVPVRGNPELIKQLLADLLDNAERQATSTVTLRLRTTPQFAVLEAIVDDSASSSHHYSTEVLPFR